jgi:hypothetical protein
MIKRIVGITLLVIGVFIALVLFTYGGPVFPHIIGPVVFATVGAIVLLFKSKENKTV